MRTNKIINHESILHVLGETDCPFCRFLKNFQASLLKDPTKKEIHHPCSFDTWGLAATQRAASAAFPCDICVLLQMEEDRRIREFVGSMQPKRIAQWMRSQAFMCIPHGTKLKPSATPVIASAIGAITERCRNRLVEDITRLSKEFEPETTEWGLLGHAAEFLAPSAGCVPKGEKC